MSKAKTFFFSKKLLQVIITFNTVMKGILLFITFYLISLGHFDMVQHIISCSLEILFGFIMLIKLKKTVEPRTIPLAWKIITLIFCSFLCGILLLVQRDDAKASSPNHIQKSNAVLFTPFKKFIILTFHAVMILMIWCIPCVRYGRLSWDGLEGSNSTTLGSAIADFASYDSSEASTLLVLLILVHISAILFLIFTCIGKHKPPMIVFSSCTVGFTCLLNLIANSYETIKITVSDSFWGASVAAYEIDDSVQFTVLFAIATLIVTFIMILRRSGTSVMSTIEDTPISATEPTPTSASDPTSVQTLEERLTQLNDLKARGLITEEEYNEKKQTILSEL